jgi:hypothetical protein
MIYTPLNVHPDCSVYFVPKQGNPYLVNTVTCIDTTDNLVEYFIRPLERDSDGEYERKVLSCRLIIDVCSDKRFPGFPDLIIVFE